MIGVTEMAERARDILGVESNEEVIDALEKLCRSDEWPTFGVTILVNRATSAINISFVGIDGVPATADRIMALRDAVRQCESLLYRAQVQVEHQNLEVWKETERAKIMEEVRGGDTNG